MELLTLRRVAIGPEGAFGVLVLPGDAVPFAVTLERTHLEGVGDGRLVKIQPGRHRCRRSYFHRGGYMTYEVEAPGHSRILFHRGNTAQDSEGCVLVGETFTTFRAPDNRLRPGIGSSALGFSEFMGWAAARAEFDLLVLDPSKEA